MSFEHYPLVGLSEVMDIQGGAQPPASTFKDLLEPGYVRFVQIRDFETDAHLTFIEQLPKWRYCSEADVLIARYGASVGRICRGVAGAYNVALAKVIPSEHVSREFLYYLLRSEYFQGPIAAMSGRSAQAGFNKSDLAAIRVPLPSPKHQQAIVAILGVLDDRITLLRETNATLEAIAQALFKSWFVDFDPVRAKAEGRQPEGMNATTAALFPDSFEECELGLVPKGWSLVPFGELLAHTIGGDWGDESPSDKNDIRVAIIRGTDIPDLQQSAANRVPIRYTSSKKLSTRKLQDGDLVLEVSGGSKDQPTGRALYLTDHLLGQFGCPVEPASFCRLLRPASRDIGVLLGQQLTYIYSIGKTWEYQNQSTGIANFQTAHFLESELVVVPSPEVLAEFSEMVRPMIDRAHQSQIRELTQLRETLLPRLISGQLRLLDAESLLEKTL